MNHTISYGGGKGGLLFPRHLIFSFLLFLQIHIVFLQFVICRENLLTIEQLYVIMSNVG